MLVNRPVYKGDLNGKRPEEIPAYEVFRLFPEGDEIASEVLGKAIEMWGMASAYLVSLLNPGKIIWGGGVFGPAAALIPEIYGEALKWAQPISIRQVEFVPDELGPDAGLFGAARLALTGDSGSW
jgi:glucokinase